MALCAGPRTGRVSRVPSASGSRGREAAGRRCVRTAAPQARLTTAKPRRNGRDRPRCRRAAGTPSRPSASPTPAFPLPRPGYLGPAGGTAQVSGSLLSSPPPLQVQVEGAEGVRLRLPGVPSHWLFSDSSGACGQSPRPRRRPCALAPSGTADLAHVSVRSQLGLQEGFG